MLKSATARSKIVALGDLTERCCRPAVLCHGTFDLLHIGHVHHLRAAKAMGAWLVVTITADADINRGPGRPVFNEHQRAEMLAALDFVDAVSIVHDATALPAIAALRPDIYVKGIEYADTDITGNFKKEYDAVIAFGGRVEFTDEETHSSSVLLNRHFGVHDGDLAAYLGDFRSRIRLDDLVALLDRVKDYRVLMIGDSITDDYRYVSTMGKSSKEPIICVQEESCEEFAGGVHAAAKHVASFCKTVDIVTGSPTRKIRYIDKDYMRKLFEVYQASPDGGRNYLVAPVEEYDVVIVTDFGHGLVTPAMIDTLKQRAKFLAVNAQTNTGNHGFNLITRYGIGVDYICVDAPEARLALAERVDDSETLAGDLMDRIKCNNLVITNGKHGCIGHNAVEGFIRAPAFTKTVVDTVGAGDAFFAVTAPLAAAGATMEQIAFLGNAAGAIKVGILGHRSSVEKVALLKFAGTLLK
jgi:rfaE bifunctional protein nucleotidyltransferase chain/domain